MAVAERESTDIQGLTGEFTDQTGCSARLEFNQTGVTWKGQQSKDKGTDAHIPWCDVITVYRGNVSKDLKNPETASVEGCFTVHYVQHNGNLLRHRHITFDGKTDEIQQWVDRISSNIPADRPKRLLVIINPIGGKKKGVQIYERTVAPLFNLAGINADVKVTERFRHAEEIGQNYDFSSVDGVVVSGGDGLLEEFLHSFIPRFQEGCDIHDPAVELRQVPVTVGTLPTGTGNGISKSCVGCEDVETSALHVVTGRRRRLNVISIHEPGKLIGYSAVALGYGFWSDLIRQTEEKRWLKTLRVYVSLLQGILRKKRQFTAKGEYLPVETGEGSDTEKSTGGWREFQGCYTGVNALVPGYYRDETHGVLQMGQDGDGFNFLLEKDTGKIKYMTWLAKMAKYNIDALQEDFIEHHYVKAYRVRVVHAEEEGEGPTELSQEEQTHRELEHMMAVDGELRRTEKKELEVRLQPRLIEFYSSSYETYQK